MFNKETDTTVIYTRGVRGGLWKWRRKQAQMGEEEQAGREEKREGTRLNWSDRADPAVPKADGKK